MNGEIKETDERSILYLELSKIDSENNYFIVKGCIEKYLEYNLENKKLEIYNILDSEYIKSNDIDKENVLEKIQQFKEKQNFQIVDIYNESIQGENYFIYTIHIKISPESNLSEIKDIYFQVNLDIGKFTFSINPITQKQYNDIVSGKIKNSTKIISIKENENNTYQLKYIDDLKMLEEYLSNYKKSMIYNSEYAYEKLDEEYKEKRFPNIEKFNKYIQDNKNQIETGYILEYKVLREVEYTEYTAIDKYDNYYIIKAKTLLDYTIQLDNYTIFSEKVKEEYLTASNQEKIVTGINIFISMINSKDYSSAYNVLSEGFKNNYFPTEESFEKYIKENFFDFNMLSLKDFNNEGDIYLYTMVLKESVSTIADKIEKKVIIKLGEGTDFELSFNVE